MNGGFSLHNPSFDIPLGIGTRVPFDHVNVLDDSSIFGGKKPQDFPFLATISSPQNQNFIIFFYMPHKAPIFLFYCSMAL